MLDVRWTAETPRGVKLQRETLTRRDTALAIRTLRRFGRVYFALRSEGNKRFYHFIPSGR